METVMQTQMRLSAKLRPHPLKKCQCHERQKLKKIALVRKTKET